MTLKSYVNIWLILSCICILEYLALNFYPQASLLNYIKFHNRSSPFFSDLNLSPEPGRQISLYFGWAGILIMLMMNVYSIKKRFKIFSRIGPSLASTFNFHIFCGLLGPVFILLHSNLKVRGLVAISFWSMAVAATSGVLGRYLYGQLLAKKSGLANEAEKMKILLETEFQTQMSSLTDEKRSLIMQDALVYVGLPKSLDKDLNILQVLYGSVSGDVRLFWSQPKSFLHLPLKIRQYLVSWALLTRKTLYLDPLQKLMGYWHAFHLPFAFFMYAAALIHIITALLLGVKK